MMPMFDRKVCNVPKSQISFMDFFIRDMFEAWSSKYDVPSTLAPSQQLFIYFILNTWVWRKMETLRNRRNVCDYWCLLPKDCDEYTEIIEQLDEKNVALSSHEDISLSIQCSYHSLNLSLTFFITIDQ